MIKSLQGTFRAVRADETHVTDSATKGTFLPNLPSVLTRLGSAQGSEAPHVAQFYRDCKSELCAKSCDTCVPPSKRPSATRPVHKSGFGQVL